MGDLRLNLAGEEMVKAFKDAYLGVKNRAIYAVSTANPLAIRKDFVTGDAGWELGERCVKWSIMTPQ